VTVEIQDATEPLKRAQHKKTCSSGLNNCLVNAQPEAQARSTAARAFGWVFQGLVRWLTEDHSMGDLDDGPFCPVLASRRYIPHSLNDRKDRNTSNLGLLKKSIDDADGNDVGAASADWRIPRNDLGRQGCLDL
jgi:hypothetical protein